MWIFPEPIERLRREHLQRLIDGGVRENTHLDYKRDPYSKDDKGARDLLTDVVALANAEGGALILGIEEEKPSGKALRFRPMSDGSEHAERLRDICADAISEPIAGLRTAVVAVDGGTVVVVHVPRSLRRPHMARHGRSRYFYVRHDNRNSEMTIGEIRAAVTTTEELTMKVETFIERRRAYWSGGRGSLPSLCLMATPLLLSDGRVAVTEKGWADLLRTPPTRPRTESHSLPSTDVRFTLHGIAASENGLPEHPVRLELYRNGHVEFMLADPAALGRSETRCLYAAVIVEYLVNFTAFVDAVRQRASIIDPYFLTLGIWRCAHWVLPRDGRSAEGQQGGVWTGSQDLFAEPLAVTPEEGPGQLAKRVADRLWNAFGFHPCPLLDDEGNFTPLYAATRA